MSTALPTLTGTYYDGRQPIGSGATMILGSRAVALVGERVGQRYALGQLRVSPRVGRSPRFVALPDGGQLQCADHPLLDTLPHDVQAEGIVAWLEQRWIVAVASIAAVVVLLASGYFLGLPAAAESIAARIPIETESALGRQALTWLDGNRWFSRTRLDKVARNRIQEGFAKLHSGLPLDRHYSLEFRHAKLMGANALALPGGTIVITDQMVNASKSDAEVLAVLAHEIGHVEQRHVLRHLVQDSIVAAVAATITADAASLSVAVAGLPTLVAQAKYSREFESEADEYAFELMKRRGMSPVAFATLMERLAQEDDGEGRGLAFVSSHPVTSERAARARAAAKP